MRYVAGSEITLDIELTDDNGKSFVADAVEYTMLDGDGNVISTPAAVADFLSGTSVTITLPANLNALAEGVIREARELRLRCTTEVGQIIVSHAYVVEREAGRLVRGSNTMVTLATASMLAAEMSDALAWSEATRHDRTNALIEAYRRLCKLRFGEINLADLSVDNVLNLDSKFAAALALAQVTEAISILAGDPVNASRHSGIVVDQVGDVRREYRGNKPIELPMSRKALSCVSYYTSVGSRLLGRA